MGFPPALRLAVNDRCDFAAVDTDVAQNGRVERLSALIAARFSRRARAFSRQDVDQDLNGRAEVALLYSPAVSVVIVFVREKVSFVLVLVYEMAVSVECLSCSETCFDCIAGLRSCQP